jgi:hypothetical protein
MIGKHPIICGIRKNIMLLQQKQGGRAVSGIRVASFMRLYFSIRERALSQINFLMLEYRGDSYPAASDLM